MAQWQFQVPGFVLRQASLYELFHTMHRVCSTFDMIFHLWRALTKDRPPKNVSLHKKISDPFSVGVLCHIWIYHISSIDLSHQYGTAISVKPNSSHCFYRVKNALILFDNTKRCLFFIKPALTSFRRSIQVMIAIVGLVCFNKNLAKHPTNSIPPPYIPM